MTALRRRRRSRPARLTSSSLAVGSLSRPGPEPTIEKDGHGWEPIQTRYPSGRPVDFHAVWNMVDDDCAHPPLAIFRTREEAEAWARANLDKEDSEYGNSDWYVGPVRDLDGVHGWNSIETPPERR